MVFYSAMMTVGAAMLVYHAAFMQTFGREKGHPTLFIRMKRRRTADPSLYPKYPPIGEGHRCETVETVAEDGVRLVGDLWRNPQGRGVVILFHGYRSSCERDFGGIFDVYYQRGYTVLAPDQRGHGRSGGDYITFGILERYDCKSWIEYAQRTMGETVPIYLAGMSMGATTVLMSSGLEHSADLRGIIADCAFTSPMGIIEKVGRDMKAPPLLFLPQLRMMCRGFASFDPSSVNTVSELEKCRVPLLIIHGTNDRLVPYEMALENYSAGRQPKMLVSVEGADHGSCHAVNTALVEKKISEFFALTEEKSTKIS